MTTTTADQVIDKVIELLKKIEQKIDQFTDRINQLLAAVPSVLSWVVDKIKQAWNTLLAKVKEFWDWFTDKLLYMGNPGELYGAADSWRQVGGKVSRINDDITALALTVDDHWTGRAADQYKQSLDPQRRANTSINTDFAANIATALSGLGQAIIVFWGAIAAALVTLTIAIVSSILLLASVIAGPAAIVTAVGGFVGALVAMGVGLAVLYGAAANARQSIDTTSNGITSWPQIATA
jgi:ABC-type multidrug transport system fused ATPase/permease subunit